MIQLWELKDGKYVPIETWDSDSDDTYAEAKAKADASNKETGKDYRVTSDNHRSHYADDIPF